MKKILSFVLITLLLLLSATPSMGATTDSQELEKAILAVKKIIEVDERFTEFQYSSWTEESDSLDSGMKIWSLNWQTADGKEGIYASVDNNGVLRNYSTYSESMSGGGFGTLTKSQGEAIAKEFLAKALPEGFKDARLMDYSSYESTKYYNFALYVNGVKANFVNVNLSVDANTGKVIDYYANNVGILSRLEFPALTGIISKEAAVAAFKSDIGVDLSYIIFSNYETKETKSFIAYKLASTNYAIDAMTGKPVESYSYFGWPLGNGGGAESKDQGSADGLTPEEQSEVDKIEGLLTQSGAIDALKNKVPAFANAGKLNYSSFSKDYFEERYIWNLSFEKGSGTVDAATGEIIGFNIYSMYETSTDGITLDKAKATAETLIKTLAPDKAAQVVFDLYQSNVAANSEVYYLTYARQENGIPVAYNGLSVTVNKKDGKITGYFSNWNARVEFPPIGEIITEDAAFAIYDGKSDFNLAYILDSNKKAVPAYMFMKDASFNVDPITGALIDYQGKPYTSPKSEEGYTDISGKWYEKTVVALYENGYYLPGDKFNGNSQITQEGFLRYLYSNYYGNADTEDLYDMLIMNGIVKEEEKAPDNLLARQDAAKFAVRYLGLGLAGEQSGIYLKVFPDSTAAEYRGYAALVKSIGIMTGDKYGRFNGAKTMTNAEAATVIYKTLNAK